MKELNENEQALSENGMALDDSELDEVAGGRASLNRKKTKDTKSNKLPATPTLKTDKVFEDTRWIEC